jgi:hypothetical protein
MTAIGVAEAARNNAAWCDAVGSAHGSPGESSRSHWLSRAAMPPGYPNLVTLGPELEPALAAARELDRARPSAAWAVKDSFAVLPLAQAGFRLLFAAEWIVRSALPWRPRERSPGDRWLRVQSEPALAAWEAAWGESRGRPRVFPPALLLRSEVAIMAVLGAEGSIAAGVIANRSEGVVGISNFFANGEARASLRATCIDAAIDAFPGLPLVGYELGRDLLESQALGFERLGSLRIWARQD